MSHVSGNWAISWTFPEEIPRKCRSATVSRFFSVVGQASGSRTQVESGFFPFLVADVTATRHVTRANGEITAKYSGGEIRRCIARQAEIGVAVPSGRWLSVEANGAGAACIFHVARHRLYLPWPVETHKGFPQSNRIMSHPPVLH